MHKKHGKDGLVAMSVNLDDPTDKKAVGRVEKFLADQKATFPNFILDEEQEAWMKQFDIAGPPAVFVFGPDGKVAKKFEEVDYAAVEKTAMELLKKK